MALGVRDKPKNPRVQSPLGVPHDPNATPANLSGQKPKPPSVPEFSGTVPPAPTTPQVGAQNGPVFPGYTPPPPPPVQPISYNGGQYNPTTSPHGMDMSAPGVREQIWDQNQGMWFQTPQLDWVDSTLPQFQDPWAGEQKNSELMGTIANKGAGQQYWTGVQGQFNTMSPAEQKLQQGYQGRNNTQDVYGMTKGMLPGSMQPQFDAYYDRMKDKVMSDVNTQSAARGAYGSNTALNNTIGAGLDVEANRAKAATDFSLADSANQREWQGLLGNQARGADLSGLGIFDANRQAAQFGLDKIKVGGDLAFRSEDMELGKNKALSDIAFGVDEAKNTRLGTGIETALNSDRHRQDRLEGAFDASGGAQDAFEGRVGGLYDDVTDFSQDTMSFFSENYDKLLGGDAQMSDQEIEAMIAQTADERGWNEHQRARMMQEVKAAYDMITGKKSEAAAGVGDKKEK